MDAFSQPFKWTTDKGRYAVIHFLTDKGASYTVSQLVNGRWRMLVHMRVPAGHNEYTHFEQWRAQHTGKTTV